MKHLLGSLLLCFCLITPSIAASRHSNNDWRSIPFIEMMAAMMKAMNNVLDGKNSFTGLPYSPAFMPGMSNGMNGLGAFNNLPMSPAGMNSLPINPLLLNSTMSPLMSNFQSGQNNFPWGASTGNTKPGSQFSRRSGNFWDPDAQHVNTEVMAENNSLNGIWQSLSGDVIAIYNDNRFLWSDGRARNLAGYLAIKDNKMIAYVPAKNISLYFQFYREPGQFIVRDKNARIYTFKRIH